jgi:hypothetical protein
VASAPPAAQPAVSASPADELVDPFPVPTVSGKDSVVPLTIGEFMVADVRINGKGPYRVIVDTGAYGRGMRLVPSVVEELGLKQVGTIAIGDGSSANQRTVPTYAIDEMQLGDLHFHGVGVLARPLPKRKGLQGILPLGLLSQRLLTLDYGKSTMRLSTGSLPRANGRDILDYRELDGGIGVDLKIAGKSYPAMLDTGGAAASLHVPAAMLASLPTKGTARSAGSVTTTSTTSENQTIDLAAPVRLGAFVLPITSVVYPAPWEYANLGPAALEGMTITIDARNRRLKLGRSR